MVVVNFVVNVEMMKMIKIFTLLLKPLCDLIEPLWMNQIREAKYEYEKDKILTPNDGSDWRRELL